MATWRRVRASGGLRIGIARVVLSAAVWTACGTNANTRATGVDAGLPNDAESANGPCAVGQVRCKSCGGVGFCSEFCPISECGADDASISKDANTNGSQGDASSAAESAADAAPSPMACAAPVEWWDPVCGASACGNGVIDQCNGCTNQPNCLMQSEECDGDNLGDASCVALGYLGGSLSCDQKCEYDERGCTACAPIAGSLLSCRTACLDGGAPFGLLAMAATEQTVALAWMSEDGSESFSAHLLLFDRDLNLVAKAAPLGLPMDTYLGGIAVAPSSTGWLLAVDPSYRVPTPGVTVYTFDSSARPSSSPHFIAGASSPHFGVRAGGAPLLSWNEPTDSGGLALRAAIIGSDARFSSTPVDVLADDGQATILGDAQGFLVAAISNYNIVAARLSATGVPSGQVQQPLTGMPVNGFTLAALNDRVGLAFTTVGGNGYQWAALDWNGALLTGPVVLSFAQPAYDARLLSAPGDGWLVTEALGSAGMKIQGTHLNSSGVGVGATHVIAGAPEAAFDAIVMGDRAIVTFVGQGEIVLATVSIATP